MTNKTLACRSGKKGHGRDERRQNTSSQRSPTPDASSDVRCTNFTIVSQKSTGVQKNVHPHFWPRVLYRVKIYLDMHPYTWIFS